MQAVGAGILAPLALATTALVFPPAQRGLGLAMMAVVANAAAALGPPIGGVLVEFAAGGAGTGSSRSTSRSGSLGIALALRILPETHDPHAGTKVDWWGMVTVGLAVFCLTFALVKGNDWGWGSARTVGLFAAFVLLVARVRADTALRALPDADVGARPQPPVHRAPASACCCSAPG